MDRILPWIHVETEVANIGTGETRLRDGHAQVCIAENRSEGRAWRGNIAHLEHAAITRSGGVCVGQRVGDRRGAYRRDGYRRGKRLQRTNIEVSIPASEAGYRNLHVGDEAGRDRVAAHREDCGITYDLRSGRGEPWRVAHRHVCRYRLSACGKCDPVEADTCLPVGQARAEECAK